MHRILFIENREKTRFWAAIAEDLARRGHEIHWMVQNPLFGRGLRGTVHRLPFPPRTASRAGEEIRLPSLETDRGRQHFEAGSAHYPFYQEAIGAVLDRVRPHLIVGETTLFHELLAADLSEIRGIPFVHPTSERYPSERFLILHGMSQTPFVTSGDDLPWADALERAQVIAAGRESPFYMRMPAGWERRWKQLRWVATRTRIWGSRLRGERYNTPALLRKASLARRKRANMRRWQSIQSVPAAGELSILYPLQMQPEANIDVWGRPYSDQVRLVERLLAAAPADVTVSVKANPKPKYEISDELLGLAEREPRLRLLPFDLKMPEAHRLCLGAVTVSGTVGFEAVFGRGRCISLRHPLLRQHFPHMAAETPEQAVAMLLESPEAGTGTVESGAKLLQLNYARTFPGVISDPFHLPACMEEANIRNLAAGIGRALARAAGEAPAGSSHG